MNKGIVESYEYYVKIIKVMEKLGATCKIEEGASETEIAEYERKIGYKLPDDYKDWLRLTKGIEISCANIIIYIYMPDEAEDHEDGFKALFIGDDATCRNYYINLETGKSYLFDDDFGTEEFDSFEELLDEIYCQDIEDKLDDDEETQNWQSIYEEMFPEEE